MTEPQALSIVIDSQIADTNFEEWKVPLLAVIETANKTLQTDEEFVQAEADVKTLKASEDALKSAKEAALKKAEDVFKLFNDIDEVSGAAADARLALQKQIKNRKQIIKDFAVDQAVTDLQEYLDTLHPLLIAREGDALISEARAHLEDAAKGKRTSDTMQKAIDVSTGVFVAKFKQRHDMITVNCEILDAHCENNPALFSDKAALACTLDLDELKKTIDDRLAKYREQEAEKQRTAEAQENELKLRREMAEKQQDAPAQPATAPAPAEVNKAAAPAATAPAANAAPSTYQLTITLNKTHQEAVEIAKAIKQSHGDQITGIRLFEVGATATA